jgi:hypothetical protein
MGREIVYCWKCATRLQSADFENRQAFRYGDKVSCQECVYELVGDLSTEEQEAILNGEPQKPPSDSKIKARTGSTQAVKRTSGTVPTVREGTTTRQTKAIPRTEGGTSRRATGSIPKASTGSMQRATGTIKRATGGVPKVPPPEEEGDEVPEDPAAKKKKLILIGAGGGGFLIVAIVVVILLLSGNKKKGGPEDLVVDPTPRPAAPKAVDPKLAKEEATRKAFEDAMAFFKNEPDNLGGQMKQFRAALDIGKDSSYSENILRQMEILTDKMKKRIEEVSQEAFKTHRPTEKFKTLLDALEDQKKLYDIPEWQNPLEEKIKQTRGIVDDLFTNIKKTAVEHKERGEDAQVKTCLERVEKWELAEYVAKLKEAVGGAPAEVAANPDASKPKTPAAKPARKPPSAEMEKYLPGWRRAMGAAFGRDFDQATVEIRRTAKDVEGDEVKKAAEEDVEALQSVKALIEETLKLLPNKGRGQRMTLEYFDGPTSFKEVAGKVMSVNDQRFEVKTDGKDGKEGPTVFVEFADLTGKSLAELNKARKGNFNAQAAAYLNFIEGNEEAAKLHGGQAANKVPDRYWDHAPEAKEKAPKSNTKEFDARNAFHGAELDWRDVKTWGNAFEKYRLLNNEYAATAIVRKNQALILKRVGMGKDYFYFPASAGLKLNGNFNFKLQKDDPLWLSTADAEGRDILENYVEVDFYALPNTTYRAWAYVAACCKETFAVYYQTSEGKTRDGGKDITIDPGSLALAPLPNQLSGLKNTHDLHKPKDAKAPHPKTPARWEWIPIPLPKTYSGHGAKGIRICTSQPGFAVRFMIVSSTRTKTPDEKETAEFLKEAAAQRDEAAGAAPKVATTPDPSDWLVVGPFDAGLDKVFAPEQGVDVDQEMQSKDKKKIKWARNKAELRDAGGSKAAVFDFAKMFNPKENVTAYALIHVRAPAATEAKLLLGRDDGIKIWVNETMIHKASANPGLTVDKETATIKLEEGWNRILVKCNNGTGAWGFAFRIADASKKAIPGLEYSPYGDQLVGP